MGFEMNYPSGEKTFFDFKFSIKNLPDRFAGQRVVVLTDDNIYRLYKKDLKPFKTVVIDAGEQHKTWTTVDKIVKQLIKEEVDRKYTLIGMGGGVVTDITGFVAAVYMRGINVIYIPTSLLAMVDAAIGGKNGINVDVYKNMLGIIRQPSHILYDAMFLKTLPDKEWSNGFAEIIKYGCIADENIFISLSNGSIDFYKKNHHSMLLLIKQCIAIKNYFVMEDEKEAGSRKLLNFGHTIGHAIENIYELSHGEAIAIGMVIAVKLSRKYAGFKKEQVNILTDTLEKYLLPTSYPFNIDQIIPALKADKKRTHYYIDFVLIEKFGEAFLMPLSIKRIKTLLSNFKE